MVARIGTLRESSLHAALKEWYAKPDDQLEVQVDGYWVDIFRSQADGEPAILLEIQTANFSAFKKKLVKLLKSYPVRVIYPIAEEKYIIRVANSGNEEEILSRRKSPKRGRVEQLFGEMVRIPHLACNPNFSLEVAFICEEQIWRDDGRGSWRRKRVSVIDRRLVTVFRQCIFSVPEDYLALLPTDLPRPFTVKQLAAILRQPRWLAGRMAYTLREMGVLHVVGKRGNALQYSEE